MDLTTITILVLILAASSYTLPTTKDPLIIAGDIEIKVTNGKVTFSLMNKGNGAILKGQLGVSSNPEYKVNPTLCTDDADCIQFGKIKLKAVKDGQCYNFNWTTSGNLTLGDCYDYGSDNWYGGPENNVQYWPFNNMTFKDFSYITKMEANQGVAEPYWVTSSGFYIYVDKKSPLFIDANNEYTNGLCLIAKQYPPYLPRGGTYLGYKVCAYDDAREAHMNAVKHDLGSPTGIPDPRMIKHPVWSTWARYKLLVNETAVKQFAQDIVDNGFNNSQLEIDDNWETCYGSSQFNTSRFPNMPSLGKYLHKLGFRITLWNHPFVNKNCPLFSTLQDDGYLVKDQSGNVVSTWWDGEAGAVDFTNPDAARWFLNYHRDMMANNHIDGLKLDAGESSWLPQIPVLNSDPEDQPNSYSSAYTRTVAQFGDLTEVRVGHGTQDLPIFVRMLDKDSKWTFENGLPTLLTTLFQLNLNGYTLVLPDMVGGNGYGQDVVTKELLIRWLQANTFMPAIQFSIAPFDFDEETVRISKKFTSLHVAYSGKIIRTMRRSVRFGTPVNTPIWWVAPTDPEAHSVWDQYMLGEDLLVAPVVQKGATSRDIYLPCGRWKDENSHRVYHGQQWLRNYQAPLDILPYFSRVGSC
ncbi:myogenesis-regulating glycosidase-like [Macrosteles quadrilineatus]|uniref:myogenesis-regulating glycosidase-like n=1 Tax=Macrosteles quadrilineatus TaxID=74068 RepID=UPI0023E27940|nr:myogenesis-regulating glycosidase-like [Macrosteles quadrilineatus]